MGCSNLGDNYDPEEVNLTKDIAKVAAGHYHSLAINAEGKLWTWGYAKLLLPAENACVACSLKITTPWLAICRRNNEGQLGQALQPQEAAATPAAVDGLANFKVQPFWQTVYPFCLKVITNACHHRTAGQECSSFRCGFLCCTGRWDGLGMGQFQAGSVGLRPGGGASSTATATARPRRHHSGFCWMGSCLCTSRYAGIALHTCTHTVRRLVYW